MINAHDIIDKGLSRFEFDANKVKLVKASGGYSSWTNEKHFSVVFEYDDPELANAVKNTRYSTGWSKSLVTKTENRGDEPVRLLIVRTKNFPLRKKKGCAKKSGIEHNTANSIADAEIGIQKFQEKYNMDLAIQQFSLFFEDFTLWLEDEEKKAVVSKFGNVGGYKDIDGVEAIDKEIALLRKQITELKQKRFDIKKKGVIEFLQSDTEACHEDFKQLLVDAVKDSKPISRGVLDLY